jgi:hypothetical protein
MRFLGSNLPTEAPCLTLSDRVSKNPDISIMRLPDLRVVRVDQVRLELDRRRQIERCHQFRPPYSSRLDSYSVGIEHSSVPKWSTDLNTSVFSAIRRSPPCRRFVLILLPSYLVPFLFSSSSVRISAGMQVGAISSAIQ